LKNSSVQNELAPTIMQAIKETNPQTLEQLADLVKERLQIPEQEILESILKLQSEGKIGLAKPSPPTYLKTEQALWYWATIATAIATAMVVFAIPENLYS